MLCFTQHLCYSSPVDKHAEYFSNINNLLPMSVSQQSIDTGYCIYIHITEKCSKSSTHYLNNTTEFDVSNALVRRGEM